MFEDLSFIQLFSDIFIVVIKFNLALSVVTIKFQLPVSLISGGSLFQMPEKALSSSNLVSTIYSNPWHSPEPVLRALISFETLAFSFIEF